MFLSLTAQAKKKNRQDRTERIKKKFKNKMEQHEDWKELALQYFSTLSHKGQDYRQKSY